MPNPDTLGDLLVSYIRTGVPLVVGLAIAFIFKHAGIGLDEAKVSAWLEPLCIGGYYAAVRWAETRWHWVGWLLGMAKRPVYEPPAPKI